jgi:hypothetical protein
MLIDKRMIFDGCTVHVDLSIAGGAAAKAKALQERMERERQAIEERESWLELADKTQETGVMRLVSTLSFLENTLANFAHS